MKGPDIVCRGVTKHFGTNAAVAPLTLSLAAGATTALVGPSGCGKSTILRMIAGLETPSDGDICLGSETPSEMARRGALAMAFQDPALLPWRTVRANVALGAELARKKTDQVDALIDLVGLSGFADFRPAELSGGMRQRAAIARSLVSEPEILLLDEPFGAVDAMTRNRLNTELPPLWRERGTTAVLVTHSVAEAVLLSDRVIVLSPRPARVVADIPVQLDNPRHHRDTDTAPFLEVRGAVITALENAA
ncbi:MAG: ABC transporter ATP-binding protein [Pseudomonadota bacterium]